MDIYERISKIPGDQGFWKSNTSSAYQAAADRLLILGMSEDDIIEFLSNLYFSTAEEYGE